MPVALDEAGGNRHAPIAAACLKMTDRRPVNVLGQRTVIRQEAVTGVDHLGQDGQRGPVAMSVLKKGIGMFEVSLNVTRLGAHLDGSRNEFQGLPFPWVGACSWDRGSKIATQPNNARISGDFSLPRKIRVPSVVHRSTEEMSAAWEEAAIAPVASGLGHASRDRRSRGSEREPCGTRTRAHPSE